MGWGSVKGNTCMYDSELQTFRAMQFDTLFRCSQISSVCLRGEGGWAGEIARGGGGGGGEPGLYIYIYVNIESEREVTRDSLPYVPIHAFRLTRAPQALKTFHADLRAQGTLALRSVSREM